jgi:hypothetical protein
MSSTCPISPKCHYWRDGKCWKDYLPTDEEIEKDLLEATIR